MYTLVFCMIVTRLYVLFCHQGTEGQEEQSVGSYAA